MEIYNYILVGCFGALFQELLYWYNLRSKLAQEKYIKLLSSKEYWIITSLMIIFSGIGAWIWFYGTNEKLLRNYFIVGAGLPLLLKKSIEAMGNSQLTKLGKTNENVIKDYFDIKTNSPTND